MSGRTVLAEQMFDLVDIQKWETNSAKWVKALRSGRYEQTNSVLKEGNEKDGYSYCCLGLACQLGRVKQLESFGIYRFGKAQEDGLPPAEFARWLGFDPDSVPKFAEYNSGPSQSIQVLLNNPRPVRHGYRVESEFGGSLFWQGIGQYESLADINDNGASFETIADMIERYGIQMRWSG